MSRYLTIHGEWKDEQNDSINNCALCGMPCQPGEYHPFAACRMFEQERSSTVVNANLLAVVNFGRNMEHTALADAHRLLEEVRKNILDYQVGALPPAGTWNLIDRIDAHLAKHGGNND